MLKCGMYETDITPSLGLHMPGYFHERLGSGIRDRLYAKAAVFDNGEKVLAIVTVDACSIAKEAVGAIRKRILEFTGIQAENIMVSAIHTHTGGSVGRNDERSNELYYLIIVERAADAAIMAFNLRKPAKVGFGKGMEQGIAFNRRYFMKNGYVKTNPGLGNPDIIKPTGPIDPDVTLIRIDDTDGDPIGVVSSYACHLDTIGGTEYSADYPGEMSEVIKKALGQNVVSMFLTGPCGNINHIDVNWEVFPDSSQHYKRMGRILAGEVLKVREKIELQDGLCLHVGNDIIVAGIRRPTIEDVKKAEEFLKATPKKKLNYWDDEQVEVYFAEQTIKVYNDPEKHADMEIQVMRLGDMAISAVPCELFVEFGLDIKKRSPAKYNIVNTLANGIYGYVSVREAFGQGGYETRISSYTNKEADTGYKIVDCVIRLLEEM